MQKVSEAGSIMRACLEWQGAGGCRQAQLYFRQKDAIPQVISGPAETVGFPTKNLHSAGNINCPVTILGAE
jgi:hypothetical protein